MQSPDRREELLERAYRRGYALRRRRQWTTTLATLAVVVIVGTGVFAVARPSDDHTLSVVPTTTTAPTTCLVVPPVTQAVDAPRDVADWSIGAPVVGSAHLWTARSALDVQAVHDSNVWRLKFPWFTRLPFGLPQIDGRRIDGPGTFHSDVNKATSPDGTDWVASSLEFSEPGCWEITARYYDPTLPLTFRVEIGAKETALEHALRRFGVVVNAAPPSAVDLGDAKFCGTETRSVGPESAVNEAGRRCFREAFDTHRPAVFVMVEYTVEGDPIVTIYRSQADGAIDKFVDSTQDKFGQRDWQGATCGRLAIASSSSSPNIVSYGFAAKDCSPFTTVSG